MIQMTKVVFQANMLQCTTSNFMKTKYICLITLALILLSCNNNKIILNDDVFVRHQKIKQKDYTKVKIPYEFDMDSIDKNEIEFDLPVKNIGTKNLTDLVVKTTCDCTTLNDYPKTLKPNQEIKVKVKINIDEQGYFSKRILVYGSFNPLVHVVSIDGYKK